MDAHMMRVTIGGFWERRFVKSSSDLILVDSMPSVQLYSV